jgi:16S rRNA (uracil1498-N3)-methyltransferase
LIARVHFDVGERLRPGETLTLPPQQGRHVVQALRMRVGEPLTLFTGSGGEYEATIERIERRDVVVRVQRHVAIERESTFAVTLVQSLIAADMMDLVVRKAVELGVASIMPVQAARSQGAPAERTRRRVEHWRQIVIAACEQCGRNRIPPVHDVVALSQWLASFDANVPGIVLDGKANASLAAIASRSLPRFVLSGPEGGFTSDEVQSAIARGFVAAHLGPRVLRAETAPLAALATIDALVECQNPQK